MLRPGRARRSVHDREPRTTDSVINCTPIGIATPQLSAALPTAFVLASFVQNDPSPDADDVGPLSKNSSPLHVTKQPKLATSNQNRRTPDRYQYQKCDSKQIHLVCYSSLLFAVTPFELLRISSMYFETVRYTGNNCFPSFF